MRSGGTARCRRRCRYEDCPQWAHGGEALDGSVGGLGTPACLLLSGTAQREGAAHVLHLGAAGRCVRVLLGRYRVALGRVDHPPVRGRASGRPGCRLDANRYDHPSSAGSYLAHQPERCRGGGRPGPCRGGPQLLLARWGTCMALPAAGGWRLIRGGAAIVGGQISVARNPGRVGSIPALQTAIEASGGLRGPGSSPSSPLWVWLSM